MLMAEQLQQFLIISLVVWQVLQWHALLLQEILRLPIESKFPAYFYLCSAVFCFITSFFFKNVTTMKSSVFVLVTLLSTLSMCFSLSDHCLIFTTAWFDLLWRVKGKLVLLYSFWFFEWFLHFFSWILFVWCLFWHEKNVKRMNVIFQKNVIFAVPQPVAWLVVGCDVFRGFLGIPLPAKQVVLERL